MTALVRHLMDVVETDDRVTVYLCPQCGRRVLIDRVDADYIVIVAGDPYVLHSGTSGPVRLTASIEQP